MDADERNHRSNSRHHAPLQKECVLLEVELPDSKAEYRMKDPEADHDAEADEAQNRVSMEAEPRHRGDNSTEDGGGQEDHYRPNELDAGIEAFHICREEGRLKNAGVWDRFMGLDAGGLCAIRGSTAFV